MKTISSTYLGALRIESTHNQSGTVLNTDAPVDNNGKGESFSPTDLVATALGNCIMTIMGIKAQQMNLDLNGTSIQVQKIMSESPRRIGEIVVELDFPKKGNYTEKDKKILEAAARTCPVSLSLHPETKQTLKFNW